MRGFVAFLAKLIRGLVSLLTEETHWGRVALMALVAAILVQIALPIPTGLLALLPLLVFTVGGILVERWCPRHPFWNSLVFGAFGVVFALGLSLLRYLELAHESPPFSLVLWMLIPMASFIPQTLIGTWIVVTIRRAREMAQEGKRRPGKKGKSPTPRKRRREKADRGKGASM